MHLEEWIKEYHIVYKKGTDSKFAYYMMDTQQKVIYILNTKDKTRTSELIQKAYDQYKGEYKECYYG